METIIAALISAAGSIIAALVSRSCASTQPIPSSTAPSVNSKRWWVFAALFVTALTAGSLASWDIAEFGAIFVLITSVIMSFWAPVRPWTAIAFVLALHPVALVLFVVAKEIHNVFHVYWESSLLVLLAILFFNAALAGGICKWKFVED